MKGDFRISNSEWKVMEVIWDKPPGTTREVTQALADEEEWKPQTIKTLLARLVKKEILRAEPQGNRYLYHPLIAREEAIAAETESFVSRICKGSLEPMLSHFIQSDRQFDESEIAALRRILAKETKSKNGRKRNS